MTRHEVIRVLDPTVLLRLDQAIFAPDRITNAVEFQKPLLKTARSLELTRAHLFS